ncbi:molecular chaperone DnaJ [Brevundimonas sp. LM2]|uniref:DnaJ C-terminal domain-containing protein n=1 Tax=Brevundimonas sp. LM2 TaxID=1938605 RepID=UPI000984071B|nr:DnaJ C-terminal domain-containing protein [Brevundimonas sp. LM2]AQR61566.1 molecular chaperone DnaJ [Brevundimonas sp. LM2]
MTAPGLTLTEAYAVLGLRDPADRADLTCAFRLAVKSARPDLAGGDEQRFREVIAAYRLIQSQTSRPAALPAPSLRAPAPPVVGLTPMQALAGGEVTVHLGGRTLNVHAPAGLRTGDHLRLKAAGADGSDLHLPVLVRPGDGLVVLGDDLHMRWGASPRLLADGGRVEIETHAGLRSAWLTPGLQSPVRLRLRDLGLPARGNRQGGHLFVTLFPSEDVPSAAEDLLARFTRVWTPDRLAA